MYFNELSLLSLNEIYNMNNSQMKSFELIKRLLADEIKRLEIKNDTENIEFVKETMRNLILFQDTRGSGHNLD